MNSTMLISKQVVGRVATDDHTPPPERRARLFLLATDSDKNTALQALINAGYTVLHIYEYDKTPEARVLALSKAYGDADTCDGVAFGDGFYRSKDALCVLDWISRGGRTGNILPMASVGKWLCDL
jgi:hypothetical protein